MTTVRAERHAEQTGDVERHSDDDHQPGVAPVGEWSKGHLGNERRQEAHRHDQAERTLADAVLVAKLVEHGEHHPIT